MNMVETSFFPKALELSIVVMVLFVPLIAVASIATNMWATIFFIQFERLLQ